GRTSPRAGTTTRSTWGTHAAPPRTACGPSSAIPCGRLACRTLNEEYKEKARGRRNIVPAAPSACQTASLSSRRARRGEPPWRKRRQPFSTGSVPRSRVDDLPHVPGAGDPAGGLQPRLRRAVAQLRRPGSAVHALHIDTPAALLLQEPRPAAQGAVKDLDLVKFVHAVLLPFVKNGSSRPVYHGRWKSASGVCQISVDSTPYYLYNTVKP